MLGCQISNIFNVGWRKPINITDAYIRYRLESHPSDALRSARKGCLNRNFCINYRKFVLEYENLVIPVDYCVIRLIVFDDLVEDISWHFMCIPGVQFESTSGADSHVKGIWFLADRTFQFPHFLIQRGKIHCASRISLQKLMLNDELYQLILSICRSSFCNANNSQSFRRFSNIRAHFETSTEAVEWEEENRLQLSTRIV